MKDIISGCLAIVVLAPIAALIIWAIDGTKEPVARPVYYETTRERPPRQRFVEIPRRRGIPVCPMKINRPTPRCY